MFLDQFRQKHLILLQSKVPLFANRSTAADLSWSEPLYRLCTCKVCLIASTRDVHIRHVCVHVFCIHHVGSSALRAAISSTITCSSDILTSPSLH